MKRMILGLMMLSGAIVLPTMTIGCGQPVRLQYDFGRAYMTAMTTQANLTRTTVVEANYPLSGVEGVELRMRVVEESTDAETGQAQMTNQ